MCLLIYFTWLSKTRNDIRYHIMRLSSDLLTNKKILQSEVFQ